MAKVTQERIQSFAFVISIMMCAAIAGGFVLRGVAVQGWPRQIQLDDRINPNNAPAVSLMRLQGVGLSRAEAIVACRENFGEKGEGARLSRGQRFAESERHRAQNGAKYRPMAQVRIVGF